MIRKLIQESTEITGSVNVCVFSLDGKFVFFSSSLLLSLELSDTTIYEP